MHIIDTHAHIFSDRIASAAVKATNVFYDGCCNEEIPVPIHLGHLPGTADDLLDRCRRSGVDRAVVFCTATHAHQVRPVNDFIAGAGSTAPSSSAPPPTPTRSGPSTTSSLRPAGPTRS